MWHPRTALGDDDGICARAVGTELEMPSRGQACAFNQSRRAGIAKEWVGRTVFSVGQPRERVAGA
jgi:hypothetical protein